MKKKNTKSKFLELIEDIIDSFLTNDWFWWISKRVIEDEKKNKKQKRKKRK
jgi:hypothetical protein